ncbi:MAG: 30S ribosomal protein S2 [Candidatus Komeilibacteria bacterium CG11_big_fil_rev_8_21_14_0_20_36_20]|uniref:Small ribosomal subunit protein uS2 n=1 Tax=Candidatus Komeilibacteria bacterium CG11_big_fil_rev_8_21_14_0_20_36_20 TaxID=1974477 RepID=A0A2H0NB20_9BACT|nr:MAG: 30S ribosomal protein S2 [Candidatus Komeilibacteria bacterium CG11_big_fil_rev_8_21_14_0_20_36_20]PIR82093.1 MAG: 30S ribosomal protein S2 [Candidatus Komeilibacteria bacterium CG10_big_fil_rev_8_21_14_0_10_36_65]PJC55057.1 MAG: 30S ribosomal protein S2 [Candidatus Komeilibacteria bacterium CG_4_9_14_0_2_um_filter_36_13]
MTIPSLEDLLNKGVHFGHQTSKRYPKASTYIYTQRNGVHIIDLEKTVEGLKEALSFVEKKVKAGGVILFIGSKKQARQIVKQAALSCGMPYIVGRWLGGTFTNFENIVKLTKRLEKLIKDEEQGAWEVYTKKEQVTFRKEKEKLLETVGGISQMKKLPQAIFVVDIKKEKTAVTEANKMGIPIVAMTDTNVNPELVDYPIPANDDAIKSIEVITGAVAETAKEATQATIQKSA